MTLIIEKEGNLLDAEENLILHCVNAQGKMGSGVAKQIREKWSNVYDEYKKWCDMSLPQDLIGDAQFVPVGDSQLVVNLFGQLKYGYDKKRYVNYEGIYKALEGTADYARKYSLSVALPKFMASDLAGGNWNIVYTMIEEVFKNHTQPIAIYKLKGESNFLDKDSSKTLMGLRTPVMMFDEYANNSTVRKEVVNLRKAYEIVIKDILQNNHGGIDEENLEFAEPIELSKMFAHSDELLNRIIDNLEDVINDYINDYGDDYDLF